MNRRIDKCVFLSGFLPGFNQCVRSGPPPTPTPKHHYLLCTCKCKDDHGHAASIQSAAAIISTNGTSHLLGYQSESMPCIPKCIIHCRQSQSTASRTISTPVAGLGPIRQKSFSETTSSGVLFVPIGNTHQSSTINSFIKLVY